MIGILTPDEVDSMLRRNRVGRLGCSANDRPYVVPIGYAYDGTYLYSYGTPGRKIEVMREQPLVCFQLDEIEWPSTWRSVVAEGVYEELTDEPARRRAIGLLANGAGLVARGLDASFPMIVYRIRLTESSGRFERRDA